VAGTVDDMSSRLKLCDIVSVRLTELSPLLRGVLGGERLFSSCVAMNLSASDAGDAVGSMIAGGVWGRA
jgi:hypothetical protein